MRRDPRISEAGHPAYLVKGDASGATHTTSSSPPGGGDELVVRRVFGRQARALALSAANSSAVMAPESSSSLALAICSGAEAPEPATERT